MHDWSDENVDWNGINDAAGYIGYWLRKWVRMDVRDVKEKFGTVRVYCSFGWSSIYSIYRPGYCWYPEWWPVKLDLWLGYDTPIFKWLNKIIIPIQIRAYRWRYRNAVRKWPHLREEIMCCADHQELLK